MSSESPDPCTVGHCPYSDDATPDQLESRDNLTTCKLTRIPPSGRRGSGCCGQAGRMMVPPGGGLVPPAPGGPAQPEGKLGGGKEPRCPSRRPGGRAGRSRRPRACQAQLARARLTARSARLPGCNQPAGPQVFMVTGRAGWRWPATFWTIRRLSEAGTLSTLPPARGWWPSRRPRPGQRP
jgi:hypothetical protein